MSLSDDIYDQLQALVAGRCYRSRLPQPFTLPALTYHRVDTGFEYAHDGDSTLIHPRYQVSCWAETNAAAEALARNVQLAMDTFPGALPQDQHDLTDPETGVHQAVIDFIIWRNVT